MRDSFIMRPARILVVPGSNRTGSYNARLAGTIAKALALAECEVTRISLRDYAMPVYDADLEAAKGQPENAFRLARLFHEMDGVVLVSPEYNTSISPLMKNMIDWISRVSDDGRGKLTPYRGKVFAIAAASAGNYGGMRGLIHLRGILVNLGALVISEQLALANVDRALDENDLIKDDRMRRILNSMVKSIVEKAALFSTRRLEA